jgi:hypothetical protein
MYHYDPNLALEELQERLGRGILERLATGQRKAS